MKLKTAVTIFTALILSLFTAMSVSLIKVSDLLDTEARSLKTAAESVRVAKELKSRLLIHNRNAFIYAMNKDPSRLESRKSQQAQIMDLFQEVRRFVDDAEEELLLTDVENDISSYLAFRDRLNSSSLSPADQYNEISQHVDATIATIDRLIELNRAQMRKLLETIDRQNKTAFHAGILLLVVGGFVLFAIIFAVVKYLTRPLTALAKIIAEYGEGRNIARANVKGPYEIQTIAGKFNSMAERLEQKRQDQLRFIASVAHDLRNPLNSMSMASELLLDKGSREMKEISKIIYRQVRSLDRLVGDLLDTTRIEAGRLDLELSMHDIGSLIRDTVELHRSGSDLHAFKMNIADEPLICFCDEKRISQVVNNLVSNAVKYSPDGGIITVKAWKTEDRVVLSVEDQGIGIAPEDIDEIFKPFHRTKASKESSIPGIGLGLSSSRRIVEAHGGLIQVESTPGRGSVFYVTLPERTTDRRPSPRLFEPDSIR